MEHQNKYQITKKIAYQQMAENEPDADAKRRFQQQPFESVIKGHQNVRKTGAGKNILVIETEKGIRNMLEVVLKEKGYLVVTAASGNEGIVANKKGIDVILLSDSCSDASIQGIVNALKQRNPVPIIMMISPRKKKVTELFSDGADGYLMKPIKTEKLFIKIKSVLRDTKPERKKDWGGDG